MTDPVGPRVLAVIPTVGRPTLRRAVGSVLAQTRAIDELVVVWDLPADRRSADSDGLRAWLRDRGVRQVDAGGVGPSAARMAGLDAGQADADLVALLDDDDAWAPRKIELQLHRWAELATTVRYPVVSTLTEARDPAGAVVVRHRPPAAQPVPGRLAQALFRQPWCKGRFPLVVSTPSLLVPAALLRAEPFDPGRRLHEDWEWLLRVDRRPDTRVGVVEQPLTYVYTDHDPSRASRVPGGWRISRDFAAGLPAGVRGDFLLCRALPSALDEVGVRGSIPVLREALRGRPGPGALRAAGGRVARHLAGIRA